MKLHVAAAVAALAAAGYIAAGSGARAADCSMSSVTAPDGSALTILFDNMQANAGRPSMICSTVAPLNLPAGYSLGVYRVDYRGFAELAKGQIAELSVDYDLGPKGNGRHFTRKVRGPNSGDFSFTENIGAGQMKRVGCGSDASLGVTVALNLSGAASTDAEVDLDSSDGASRHGLVFHLDLKKCHP